MALEVTGKIYEIFQEAQVTDTFKKREFVLELNDGGNYSEFPKFQLIQDRCALLDSFQKGDAVKVSFDLKGRPYNGKDGVIYFTNLNVWRIERLNDTPPEDIPASASVPDEAEVFDDIHPEDDDLPF